MSYKSKKTKRIPEEKQYFFPNTHAPDKSSGRRGQKIEIVWNFIGELEQGEDEQTIERQRKSRTA